MVAGSTATTRARPAAAAATPAKNPFRDHRQVIEGIIY